MIFFKPLSTMLFILALNLIDFMAQKAIASDVSKTIQLKELLFKEELEKERVLEAKKKEKERIQKLEEDKVKETQRAKRLEAEKIREEKRAKQLAQEKNNLNLTNYENK